MKITEFFDSLYQKTALQLTGDTITARWSPVHKIGPAYMGSVYVGSAASDRRPSGFAADRSRRILPIKALMESLENLALVDEDLHLQSRSGLAAHFSERTAREKTYQELVERDAFLLHWLAELPGMPLPQITLETAISGIHSLQGGSAIRIVRLMSHDPSINVCLAGSPSRFGCWHLGMGASEVLRFAAEKACMEWLSSHYAHKEGMCPSDAVRTHGETGMEKRLLIMDHHLHSRDPQISRLIGHILSGAVPEERYGCFANLSKLHRDLRPNLISRTLTTRSDKYSVCLSANESLMPIQFGPAFDNFRQKYLTNPRLAITIPGKWRFHSCEEFLPHPFD